MTEYNPSKIIKDGNTYNFRDTTKIPLSGSNAISGDLIPSADNSIDVGSSTKNIKMLYAKGITLDAKTIDTDANGNMTYDGHIVDTIEEQGNGYIRYSNGIQIYFVVDTLNNEVEKQITFPKPFVSYEDPTACLSGQSPYLLLVNWDHARCIVRVNNPAPELYFSLMVIGHWK